MLWAMLAIIAQKLGQGKKIPLRSFVHTSAVSALKRSFGGLNLESSGVT